MVRGLACCLCLLALGCADRGGTDGGDVDASNDLDAGSAPPVDASRRDAALVSDAGVDAGPPGCACPPLPTTCEAPPPGVTTFTPEATDVASQLFDVIACADSTLQIAIYEAEWGCIQSALQAALDADSDLTIELVVDDRQCAPGSCFVDELTPADRVTIVRDRRDGLMHHKWVIADAERVWVGSTNFTIRSFCRDLNNAIVVDEPAIVARYREVFDGMFTFGEFGPVAPVGAVTGGAYTVYFSPETPSSSPPAWMNAMVGSIDAATVSVEFMIFAWTRTEISDALIAAHEEGVVVRGLVAGSYADDAPAQALRAAGIDIRVASVHSKVMIVDGTTVVTGSANWSRNAWSNNENSLWINDSAVAATYIANFDGVYRDASPVTAAMAP